MNRTAEAEGIDLVALNVSFQAMVVNTLMLFQVQLNRFSTAQHRPAQSSNQVGCENSSNALGDLVASLTRFTQRRGRDA